MTYNLAMDDSQIKVSVRGGTVTIRFPAKLLRTRPVPRGRRSARQTLKAARGMWKGRKPDGLAYQNEARGEWS